MSIKTQIRVEKVETVSKYYPDYHIHYKDYRGDFTFKLDESTFRQFISESDEIINCTEKI